MKTSLKSKAGALLALTLLAGGMALAEPPAPPSQAERMDRMALLLDLDAYQKTEVEKILKEQHEQMRAARDSARASGAERPSREEMKAKHDQYQQELHTKLSGVLNETQLKKFDALHEGRGGPGPRFGKKDRGSKAATESTQQ